MTRGKYAARADNRRVAADAEATTASHLRRIAALTSERDQLAKDLAEQGRKHAQVERVLRVQRDEGIGPELTARDHVIRELRDEQARARARHESLQKHYERLFGHIADLFKAQGMVPDKAIEAVGAILGVPLRMAPDELARIASEDTRRRAVITRQVIR